MIPSTRRRFLQQLTVSSLGLWLPQLPAKTIPSNSGLPRSTPAAQGVSSEALQAFLARIAEAEIELHSFMMVRHGHVIAEGWWAPYGPAYVHSMYSMSKSFTSTAVGLAVAEGKLKVSDRVISFFPESLPEQVSENLAALTIQDLLTMSVGNEKEPTQPVVKSEDWVRTFLAQPITHQPGTEFMYNSAATYMCSAIVQKVTGQKILDYLTPRLFEPLGITGMRWETCPKGINTGGWGLSIPTEAMAKFGQLYLQKGLWNGRQLLPAAWVEEATAFHIQQPGDASSGRPDWLQGYGYQFWRCQHGHFRGDGAFGQFTIVLPEHDAVIVMTSENKNMQGQLDLVWQHLLPAFQAASAQDDSALAEHLQGLKLTPLQGQSNSPKIESIGGKTFALEVNDLGLTSIQFNFHGSRLAFVAKAQDTAHEITCGIGQWQLGQTQMPGTPPRLISGGKPTLPVNSPVAASATWTDDSTLVMTWQYYETPHHDTVTCRFDGDQVKVSFLNSIAAMAPNPKDPRTELVGKMVG
ncbi:CubicO group peptidase, beta-lactamase class C family [Prosthecobacter debontii]|uniref:CubicO group peptidase, beta-lactamase class C family n=1 Tax=Prosthecobacter debontii TaxID=48467 RepID=A0A1T4YEE9_9BACT|nr:serine hydrolase [Prosthecobacter debontii]SKB00156.1 CubicO group peptidase, beta-lactamase class C family [Prosthecobacter debontii]